ncbi:flagellar associated protein [Dunaliella salina]|uniref:Flagellar associated protein n=1 Tax=Dunaliella salina TaxID=3046 RepID=A0ABQ7GJK4_DUNSA|nr:flagellar associated protein [Dunaliella salina]|eukprot:KAF5834784.1 flagellar associated protein [Dunaliella salina]
MCACSPQKVSDAATDYESKTSLPGLFKLRNGLQSLRPTYSEDVRSPHEEDQLRQPKLLQSLEAFLDERLAVVDRVGSNSKGYAAAKMRTDAHQQVFDAFLHSFTTYRSLLTRIKNEYDRSLDDALRSVFDNVHMQAELTTAQEQLDMTIRNAQQGAMEDAADARREIQDEVEQQEALAREAEASIESAQEETSAIRAEIARLREEEAELAKANHLAQQQLFQQSSFASSLQ